MRRPNKILEKKYISSLVVAAFLALSVLTANSIRMGGKAENESSTQTKETISPGGGEKNHNGAGRYDGNDSQSDESGDISENENTTDSRNNTDSQDTTDGRNAADGQKAANSENTSEREADSKTQTKKRTGREESRESDSQEKEKSSSPAAYSYDGKEKLTWPVLGNVILPYSMDTTVYYTTLDQYATNDGILIAAKEGDQVRAAADGRIVDISETDRYGRVVTMVIGNYYEVIYGQMTDLSVKTGDEVKEGEVLGRVAGPSRSFMLEGPHLFFKMTYKEKSVNPADYLR